MTDCTFYTNEGGYAILHERGWIRHLISRFLSPHALLIVSNITIGQQCTNEDSHHTMVQVSHQEDIAIS